jgi:transposase InsO family protein
MLVYPLTAIKLACLIVNYSVSIAPVSRRVVKALTGDLALTLRASFSTKWLRRVAVRRGDVRFFGFPKVQTPKLFSMVI